MERTLHVRIDSVLKMLLAWLRYREVFRAEWFGSDKPHPMRIFLPFLAACEWNAPRAPDGTRVLAMKDWLADLAQGGQDDLDLRLHEGWHHGIKGRDDAPGVRGIGSNDMATRAATTRAAERAEARRDFLERYDLVVFHGVPETMPRWLRSTP